MAACDKDSHLLPVARPLNLQTRPTPIGASRHGSAGQEHRSEATARPAIRRVGDDYPRLECARVKFSIWGRLGSSSATKSIALRLAPAFAVTMKSIL